MEPKSDISERQDRLSGEIVTPEQRKRLSLRPINLPQLRPALLARVVARPRRLLGFVALAAIVAVVAVVVVQRFVGDGSEAAAPIQTTAVTRQDVQTAVPAVGTLAFGSVVELAFSQSGELAELAVSAGAVVAAGDVLAQLDDTALARAVDDARTALARAQIQLTQLTEGPSGVDITRAELDISDARASFDEVAAGPDVAELIAAQAAVISAETNLIGRQHELAELQAGPAETDLADASSAVVSAEVSLSQSQRSLADLQAGASSSSLQAARDEIASAQAALDQARRDLTQAEQDYPSLLADARAQVANAEASLVVLSQTLDELRGRPSPQDIAAAERELEIARLQHDEVTRTSSNASDQDREIAAIQLAQAEQTYLEALQPPSPRDISEAEASVTAAQAVLDAARVRLADVEGGPDLASSQDTANAAERRLASAESDLADLQAGSGADDIALQQQNVAAATESLQASQARLAELRAGADAAEVRVAEENIRSAEAALAEALARLADLETGADPLDLRLASSAIERSELALTELTASASPLDVRSQELVVEDAERQLAAAEEALEAATLRAPFEAVVLDTLVVEGVQVSGAVVTLAALDSLRVEISVDEMDIASVALGQSVRLAFQALDGDAYEGTVVRISTQGQSDQGLVTFPIEIEITAPDERLLAGLSADVTIIAAESLNAMVVPRSAVQETPRGSIVMVVGSDGSTAPRLVQTGVSNDLFVEIVDGLTEGEEVLAAGASAFAGRGALQGQIPGSREGLSQRPPGGGFALGGFTRVIGGGGR